MVYCLIQDKFKGVKIVVSKNNLELIQNRMSQRYTKWALCRLTVGVASVTIATGFFFMAGGGSDQPGHSSCGN